MPYKEYEILCLKRFEHQNNELAKVMKNFHQHVMYRASYYEEGGIITSGVEGEARGIRNTLIQDEVDFYLWLFPRLTTYTFESDPQKIVNFCDELIGYKQIGRRYQEIMSDRLYQEKKERAVIASVLNYLLEAAPKNNSLIQQKITETAIKSQVIFNAQTNKYETNENKNHYEESYLFGHSPLDKALEKLRLKIQDFKHKDAHIPGIPHKIYANFGGSDYYVYRHDPYYEPILKATTDAFLTIRSILSHYKAGKIDKNEAKRMIRDSLHAHQSEFETHRGVKQLIFNIIGFIPNLIGFLLTGKKINFFVAKTETQKIAEELMDYSEDSEIEVRDYTKIPTLSNYPSSYQDVNFTLRKRGEINAQETEEHISFNRKSHYKQFAHLNELIKSHSELNAEITTIYPSAQESDGSPQDSRPRRFYEVFYNETSILKVQLGYAGGTQRLGNDLTKINHEIETKLNKDLGVSLSMK